MQRERDSDMLFNEKNKPLSFAKNQDEVASKLTEFRDNIIERFGSSQVPTPAVKEIYKQCGGGPQETTEPPAINDEA